MSKYVQYNDLILRDRGALIEALCALGFAREEIEVGVNQPLYGYHGDRRAETADIVIRRTHVDRLSGGASNDLGFAHQADGTYRAIVSEYDGGAITPKGWKRGEFMTALKHEYNTAMIPRVAKVLGLTLKPPVRQGRTVKVVGVRV